MQRIAGIDEGRSTDYLVAITIVAVGNKLYFTFCEIQFEITMPGENCMEVLFRRNA